MSATTAQWLIVLLFFVCVFGITLAEAFWLHRTKAISLGRAIVISFVPNIFCVTVGFFVSMVIFGVILAMAWDDSLKNVPAGDATIWAAVIAALVFPFALLTLAKFLLLKLFKIDTIQKHFLYSLGSSFLFFLAVSVIPGIFTYFIFR